MILAVLADALQIGVFPMFVQGALSPLDDVFDVAMAVVLYRLLGWHWELLPSSIAKLDPLASIVRPPGPSPSPTSTTASESPTTPRATSLT